MGPRGLREVLDGRADATIAVDQYNVAWLDSLKHKLNGRAIVSRVVGQRPAQIFGESTSNFARYLIHAVKTLYDTANLKKVTCFARSISYLNQ